MFNLFLCNYNKHSYTLAATGIDFKSGTYPTRKLAEDDMYKFIDKHGIKIVEVWDDTHYKTYCCENGIRFYINRL